MNDSIGLDKLTEIINEVLTKQHITMMIDMPKGTQECTIKDNTIMGPVAQFYILIAAMKTAYMGFAKIVDAKKEEELIDGVFDLLKKDILETLKEAGKEEAE